MSFVALPWAHSKDHPVPLPDRDVWVNPWLAVLAIVVVVAS